MSAAGGLIRFGEAPADPETLGVNRRQFFNRSILAAQSLVLGSFSLAMIGFLWPSLSRRLRRQGPGRRPEGHPGRDRREEAAVLRPGGPGLHQPLSRGGPAPGQGGVRGLRPPGPGGRPDRHLPEVRPSRLPGAVVPDLAVVRVPLPRFEVQPGRREEGRPGPPGSRPVPRRGRRRRRSRSTPGSSCRAWRSASRPPVKRLRARAASDGGHCHSRHPPTRGPSMRGTA